MFVVEQCPICGGTGDHWSSENGVVVDKCDMCGTIYQNPRLSDSALKEYYQSGKYHEENPSNFNWESKRADRILTVLERFKINPKSCLDVGCGTGMLLKQLEIFYFARVLGLEYNPEAPMIDEIVYSKEEVQGKYDLITCIHVLEHMADPGKEIEWMASKLNEGGTILLEIPMYKKIELPHLYVFTREALELMLDGRPYVYLDYRHSCQILIGDKYANSTTQEVYYSYDSPDFDTKQEYIEWLGDSYD